MKINIYSYVYWPEHFLVNELAEEFATSDWIVSVSTGLPNYQTGKFADGYSVVGPYKEVERDVSIFRYPVFPRGRGFFRLSLNYLSHFIFGMANIFRLPRADWHFVFATSPILTVIPAIFSAKIRGGKVVIWLQDLWPESLNAVGFSSCNSFLVKSIGQIVKWIYKRTDLMLIQSPVFVDNLKRHGYQGPVEVIYNWAPRVDYCKTIPIDWLPVRSERLVLVFAGNIGRAQSLNLVLDVIKEFSESLELWLVGDGSELSNLKQKVKSDRITNIIFLGRRPVEEMPSLFKAADGLLVALADHPTFYNTIPSKIAAYMAAGKAIIGLLSGAGADMIIESNAGLCAKAGDSTAFSDVIEQFITAKPDQRLEWGNNALSYFYENLMKDRLIKKMKNLLEGEV